MKIVKRENNSISILPFYSNADDICEDIMHTYNDRPPYKRELRHFVELMRHEVEPSENLIIIDY